MRQGAGKAHDKGMPKTTPLTRKINQHGGFAVTRLERVNGSEKERQAKGQFMGVIMHGGNRLAVFGCRRHELNYALIPGAFSDSQRDVSDSR